ncbi:MAG TPA: PQQ-binding-like beta-propeller repeat protein [Aldersonia sp.]
MFRTSAAALVAVAALVSAGCGGGSDTQDILAAGGWPGVNSDARNSNTAEVDGPRAPALDWSRPIGGTVATPTTISATGQAFVTSDTSAGCNLFSFQLDNGRKRFCNRLQPSAAFATPVADAVANSYVGEAGAMNSYNDHGQPRWRTLVRGTPLGAQFTGDGRLLFVTQLGEVAVLELQTGRRVAAPFQLLGEPDPLTTPDVPLTPDDQGLGDCFAGGPACPVANIPAIDLVSGRFYLTLWRPFSPTASVVAMTYTGGDSSSVRQEWSADMLIDGSATSPVLSADGTTLYVTDNVRRLIALDTATGATKWFYDLGYNPVGTSSMTAEGLIVPGGGTADGHLLALRDSGDHAELAWERTEVVQRGSPAQAANGLGYTVVRGDGSDLDLLTFDAETGATIAQDVLPDARGLTVGTSLGPDGEVATTTFIGELFVFK